MTETLPFKARAESLLRGISKAVSLQTSSLQSGLEFLITEYRSIASRARGA
jgi:hypothetical protein